MDQNTVDVVHAMGRVPISWRHVRSYVELGGEGAGWDAWRKGCV